MIIDRTTERQFLQQLLVATRANRAVWTGTVKQGCYQFNAGEFFLAVSADPSTGFSLGLHHCGGALLEILTPAILSTGDDLVEVKGVFEELFELARIQSLNLRRRWRRLANQLANTPEQADLA